MILKDLLGDYAFLAKLDVSDLDASVKWYEDKLGLTADPAYSTPGWAQLTVLPNVFIGLNAAPNAGGSGSVATFLVTDLLAAREKLLHHGVDVSPVENPGDGVYLCFFTDPDGNMLGIRENVPE